MSQYMTNTYEPSSLYNGMQAYVACEAQFSKTKSEDSVSCRRKGLAGGGARGGARTRVEAINCFVHICAPLQVLYIQILLGEAGEYPP